MCCQCLYLDMAFNVQHVGFLMTTSGKSLIWLGEGGGML